MSDAPDPSPAAAPALAFADAASLTALVEAWFARHYANSPLSRSVDLGNAFFAAKADLLATLIKE